MKKIITILLFLLSVSNIPAFSQDALEKFSNGIYEKNIALHYNQTERSTWNKYFKAQAKTIKKSWRKNKNLFSPKYKTSYARVLVAIDKNGKIVSYKIKSSCVPCGDEIFIKQVNQTINSIGKFDSLPTDYKYDLLIFTVKFHSKLSQDLNLNRIDWQRYGFADIEIDKQGADIILK